MFSFSNGLVLRKGSCTYAFERALPDSRIQIRREDTNEVVTYHSAELYSLILKRDFEVIHPRQFLLPWQASEDPPKTFALTRAQQATINFRLHYVKLAIRNRVHPASIRQLSELLKSAEPPKSLDPIDATEFAKQPRPGAWALMRWLKKYLSAQSQALALFDFRTHRVAPKRLCVVAEQLIDDGIRRHYLQLRGLSIRATHQKIQDAIAMHNRMSPEPIEIPSEKTIARRVGELDNYIVDKYRLGIGYARNKWRYSLAGDQSTRILERAEVDHTRLDLWVLDPVHGVPLGRPWVTVIVDRMSKYILGLYVSFYGPSVATVAQALKMSILPKDSLLQGIQEISAPWSACGVSETYVVDNGLEFHSAAFQRMAWSLSADLIYNPVRQPWLKSSIERCMLELNRTLPLQGKVFTPIKNALPMDPRKSAAIGFDDLIENLIFWAAEYMPMSINPKTLSRSIDLWNEGLSESPPPLFPTSFEDFNIAAGVSTERTIDGDGVFFYYMRYNSLELQEYLRNDSRKIRTEVRFDPNDLGHVYVHLPRRKAWLRVPNVRPGLDFAEGLSLLQFQMYRKLVAEKLTEKNAAAMLRQSRTVYTQMWNQALNRGLKTRSDADLIRGQSLTSAAFAKAKAQAQADHKPIALPSKQLEVIEASAVTMDSLAAVTPLKSFSLIDF